MPPAGPVDQSVEIELKLAVAPADLRALRRRLARYGRASHAQLESIYFDTRDRLLASHGFALRLRRSGDRWVQTLKRETQAAALSHRGEWETPARIVGTRPRIDRAHLAATPLGPLLAQQRRAQLREVFRTRFERAVQTVEHRAARVEIALDVGEIVAGARREPICELELELKAGPAAALPALALQLAGGRHDRALALVPYGESKAARGDRLASRQARTPAKAQAQRLVGALNADARVDEALRALVARGAETLIANVRGALTDDDPEFVHQARVALRRMRSALRLLRRHVDFPQRLDAELRAIARVLGELRDCDVLLDRTLPGFERAIAPALAAERRALRADVQRLRERARTRARTALASPRFARSMLELLAWTAQPSGGGATRLRDIAPKRLQRQHARLFDAARSFAALPAKQQHRVRIRAKRLRYAVDLFAAALPKRAADGYLRRLAALQDALGALNDLAVAQARLRALARSRELRAALRGWASSVRRAQAAAAERALARLRDRRAPWE